MLAKIVKINPEFPEENLIKKAAKVLRDGGLVAFPTETVYGIGANCLDQRAIDRLYEIKKRPRSKPFTLHITRFETLTKLGIDLSVRAREIINKFWPGPLTIVAFNRKREKIGIRMPRNKIAIELIEGAFVPVVAPSANISGGRPPVSGEEVISEMKGAVDMILDGGQTEIGKESTVLDLTTQPFTVLRPGAISKEELLAERHILFVCTGNSCRSVMAKAMLERFLKESGLSNRVYVDSAGTGAYSGILPAPNTIQVMKEEGIDVSMHKGKSISPDLLKKSDIIFVMEQVHRDIILNRLPETAPKVRLLKAGGDIPDPIGKSLEEYRQIKDFIKDLVENIFLELFGKYKQGDKK